MKDVYCRGINFLVSKTITYVNFIFHMAEKALQRSIIQKQKLAADINKDNLTDVSDASKIFAYYAMISTGKEPTWD